MTPVYIPTIPERVCERGLRVFFIVFSEIAFPRVPPFFLLVGFFEREFYRLFQGHRTSLCPGFRTCGFI